MARVSVQSAVAHDPNRTVRTSPLRRGRRWRAFRTHLPLVLIAAFAVFPFYVMLSLSFQYGKRIELPGSLFPRSLNTDAYGAALRGSDVAHWVANTAIYSVVSVLLVLILASLAAYAFAKLPFPGSTVAFWVCVAMLMVPYHVQLIPQFLLISRLGLVDSMPGLILPTLANVQALFLMRQFIRGIPNEILEAARIDGAGELRIFFRIVLPQCRPIIATLAVFVFLWHWNDFLWPLIATRTPKNYVLTVGLFSLQAQDTSLTVTMAAAVVTFLPVLFIFLALQRHFVRGVTMTGLK